MNINEMTYGVEFEVTIPAGAIITGSYQNGIPVPELPPGWVAKSDCSIHSGRGRQGAEIVSPILRGAEGVRQIKIVLDWLNGIGARVNRSTGLHVHVGWTAGADDLARLVHLVANHERALFASTGTKSRERGSFCRPVRSSREFTARFIDGTTIYSPSRYHLLNVANVGNAAKQTIEFRCFAGTLNFGKVIGHLRMALGLVEKSLSAKRKTKWVPKTPVATSPIHRSGEGQTELTRLFYALGWTKGRESRVFGDVAGEQVPTIVESKQVMMKLARKYDEQQ